MALILSLEFTDVECKAVVADQVKGGRVAVKSLSSFDLPKPEDPAARTAERAQALRDHLKSQRITIKQASIVIPKNYVMARTVTLPSTVDDEIAGMAKFEAERHIPFNADRHIISYHVMARQGMQGSDVLLAAVDLPIAQDYLDICVKAGLTVKSITVSSLAMFNSFVSAERAALADKTVMVVNIGKAATDMVIATNGNVNFTRGSTSGVTRLLNDLAEASGKAYETSDLTGMNALEPQLSFGNSMTAPPPIPSAGPGVYDELPGDDADEGIVILPPGGEASSYAPSSPTPDEAVAPVNKSAAVFTAWLNKLMQEIRRTSEFAGREFNCPMVESIYLCGEGAIINQIAPFFQANFNVDTSVFDPLKGAEVGRKVKKSDEPLAQIYAVAIGGAVGKQPNAIQINLLPGSYTEARSAKRQQRSYIVTGALALIALVVGYMYLSDVFTQKRALLEEITDQNSKDKARVAELRTKKDRLRIIRENVQDDRGALDVLAVLSEKEYFPDKIALTTFDYKRADYVKLQGDAIDLPSANLLINDMRNTGFFAEVSTDNFTPNKPVRGRDATVLGWSVTCTFPKPVKKKTKSSASKKEEDELDGLE